jgi:hypothetical protein
MATTTPNYGWAVPTSTDLVKDGATAIETLGDAIDASMNTALGTKKAGMVLLNTTSFSAVASQSVNDVFSATYQNYRIVINVDTPTSDGILAMRTRVSGTDATTTYSTAADTINSAGTRSAFGGGANVMYLLDMDSGSAGRWYNVSIDLYNPFATSVTAGSFIGSALQSNGLDIKSTYGIITQANVTSYTGFTILPTAGNISGTVRTYGYNN